MMVLLTACIFLVSIVFAMLGQGGGVLYTPVQIFFGIDFHTAAATSLFLIMATSLSATLVFGKADRVDWPLALVLESVTASGGFAGGYYSARFSVPVLMMLFAGVVVFAAFFMIRDVRFQPHCKAEKSGFPSWKRRLGDRDYCVNLAIALPVSLFAGAISGLLGIGGGMLKVPLMILLLGIPVEIAVGSSALMVGMTAAAGFAGHVISGHWDWKLSLILGVVVFVGARIGARKSIGIHKDRIKKGFGWFLLVIAALMLLRI